MVNSQRPFRIFQVDKRHDVSNYQQTSYQQTSNTRIRAGSTLARHYRRRYRRYTLGVDARLGEIIWIP